MKELLRGYQELFPNRQSANDLHTLDQLKDIIRIEMLDELTHPRVRKKPSEKLEIAKARIENSELNPKLKLEMTDIYISVFDNVNSK